MDLWTAVAERISAASGARFVARGRHSIGGGCINRAEVLEGENARYFVKLNDAARLAMFEAEAAGLSEIVETGAIRAPRPVCSGVHGDQAFLVLEYLALASGHGRSQELLGQQLARLHAPRQAQFGWRMDNTIGSTPQINTPSPDWVGFWRERRLGFQLALAARHGYGGTLQRKGERLLGELPAFFSGYTPYPSLLHGDLWSGNYAADEQGRPVIFDPAVYHGDRETDLAMTELFGGFEARFYRAYREALPLDPGYRARATLYNLYHVLNHLNLFGGGYRAQAERMLDELLSAAR